MPFGVDVARAYVDRPRPLVMPLFPTSLFSAGGRGGAPTVLVRSRETLDRFDGAGAERLVDRCVANFGLATSIREVLLPSLHELGVRWERGEVSLAHEHFARATSFGSACSA